MPAKTPYEFLFQTPPYTVPLGRSLESLVLHLMSSISKVYSWLDPCMMFGQQFIHLRGTTLSPKKLMIKLRIFYLKSTKGSNSFTYRTQHVVCTTQTRLCPRPRPGPPTLLRALTGEPACLGSIPAWPCVTCMALGELEPPFPHLQTGNNKSTSFKGLW